MILERILNFVGIFNESVAKLFAWLIIPLVGALTYEVIARYGFNAPTIWAFDLSYILYGTLFMMGMAYVLRLRAHIRVDVIYSLFPPKWRTIIDLSLYVLFFFPAVGMIIVSGIGYAWDSWEILERAAHSPWRPPIFLFKTVLPVAAFLLLLQGIAEFIRTIISLIREQRGA